MGAQLASVALQKTGHICSDCADDIAYTEEVVLLQVVQAESVDGKALFYPVLRPHDGTFLYEPYHYCFRCWENLYEQLREDTVDEPPMIDAGAAFECLCCSSSIREGEYVGTFTIGEFHQSRRSPSGVRSMQFMHNGKPEMLCLYCLLLLNLHIEMWEHVTQAGECDECVLARCWRDPSSCDCGCHFSDDYEKEE